MTYTFCTYYILRTEKPSLIGKDSLLATETAIKAEAACSLAPTPVRRIGSLSVTAEAFAGQQGGEQKLEGENVIALQIRIYDVLTNEKDFQAFLKDNGYERIPEKEEEPK